MKEQDRIRSMVRRRYRGLAVQKGDCCDASADRRSSCCCTNVISSSDPTESAGFVYSDREIDAAPEGSFMGLGCGNPLVLTGLQAGETVLDLGSGGGFDCFLAAQRVGSNGSVIGVDMTPEMVAKARVNAAREAYKNVAFRLGELESLPVADGMVDVIISNCVINLSPDKPRVFSEAFRVLKPGGRLIVLDMIAKAPLPDRLRNDPSLYCGCISGAAEVGVMETMLTAAGFESIRIRLKNMATPSGEMGEENVHQFVSSAAIEAVKPDAASLNDT